MSGALSEETRGIASEAGGKRPITVGVFVERIDAADALWTQCDGPLGRHHELVFQPGNLDADRILCFGTPWPGNAKVRLSPLRRRWAKLTGTLGEVRAAAAWEKFRGRDPSTITVLFGDPPPAVEEAAVKAACEITPNVFGPDPRVHHPIIQPATYHLFEDVEYFRNLQLSEKLTDLVVITSGTAALPGHRERLAFLRKLRAAGVKMELYGRGLPADLSPRGSLINKSAVLKPARMALVIENFAEGDLYITEKIWDPLMCWCLPLYYGSKAADKLLPKGSFVRLPDLSDAGVEAVQRAIAPRGLYERSVEAISRARRLPLGTLRLVEWYRELVLSGRLGAPWSGGRIERWPLPGEAGFSAVWPGGANGHGGVKP